MLCQGPSWLYNEVTGLKTTESIVQLNKPQHILSINQNWTIPTNCQLDPRGWVTTDHESGIKKSSLGSHMPASYTFRKHEQRAHQQAVQAVAHRLREARYGPG